MFPIFAIFGAATAIFLIVRYCNRRGRQQRLIQEYNNVYQTRNQNQVYYNFDAQRLPPQQVQNNYSNNYNHGQGQVQEFRQENLMANPYLHSANNNINVNRVGVNPYGSS